ncbi:MAG TPA: hypothetical protein VII75_07470 [Thermoanaerobaculia bacterium]|nr:hypothetical protein [Thermoanaerobaculia bacterium]
MNLDEELKLALRRKEPPPRFRDRVLAATKQRPRKIWRPLAAAALLTLVIGGTTARYVEQRREGERAKEQVLLALRITSQKLHDTREHIHELSK